MPGSRREAQPEKGFICFITGSPATDQRVKGESIMKQLEKRISQVEAREAVQEKPPLEVVLVTSFEQVQHPERFNKVLDTNQPPQQPGSLPCKWFQYERKV